MTIQEGNKAPIFNLPASNGETISLDQYKGQYVILYFYPKDNTPGCTKEACQFRDDFNTYKKKNCIILGISKDSIDSHKKFIEKQNLPFLLLSDPNNEVCELYSVWKEKMNYGKKYMGIERTTFIIDPNGNIQKIFKKVKVDGHSNNILENIS